MRLLGFFAWIFVSATCVSACDYVAHHLAEYAGSSLVVDAGDEDAGLKTRPLFMGFGDGGGIVVPHPELLCDDGEAADCYVQRCCLAGATVPDKNGGKTFITANDGFCQMTSKPCKTPLRFIPLAANGRTLDAGSH